MSPSAKWTFMVYMAGDNNLSSAGDVDLTEMRRVGSTADVNLLVEFDNAGNRGTRRYLVQRGGANERVEALPETDSGDPQSLLNFVAWARANYPAERYALVLWNHGGGWEPSEVSRMVRAVGMPDGADPDLLPWMAGPLGQIFFRTSLETILALPIESRAICSDDGSGHSLDTVELGRVLAGIRDLLGQPLDLLGMDACLMSTLEIAYQAAPFARYLVASEESEPNEGWPYEAILRKLVEAPTLPTADLAAHIVQAYIEFYVKLGTADPVTQAALDLGQIASVTAPLNRLAEALIAKLPRAATQVKSAQRKSAHFWYNTLWDIAQFGEELAIKASTKALRQAAAEVKEAMQPGAGKFVLAQAHIGASVERCGGVSLYLPFQTGVSRYYSALSYAKATRWLAFLQAYRGA